jgi:hypothetical protein
VRNDRWVRSNGAPVEVPKPAEKQGLYLHPELFGLPQAFAEYPLREPSAKASQPAFAARSQTDETHVTGGGE